jgi:uncharacterized membrane protein
VGVAGVGLLYAGSVAVVTLLTPVPGGGDAAQAAQLGLSLLWAAAGLPLVAAGLAWRSDASELRRRAGTALLALAAVKVVLLDTAHLDLGHRAGVFLAVGAVFLVGAYLYVRLARTDAEDEEIAAAA